MRSNSLFRWISTLAAILALSSSVSEAGLLPGDHVAIIGDSITEQRLYSVFVEDYLLLCQPQSNLRTTLFGWSGETSWTFLTRVNNDCLPFKPTVATICYGMNDGGYLPSNPATEEKYREALTGIVQTLKDNGTRLIVIGSPSAVDTTAYAALGRDPAVYNETLGRLGNIAKEVAEKNGVAFADVYGATLDVMAKAKAKYGNAYCLTGLDGVHPNVNGHVVIAYAFLKALGCNGDIGTIILDEKTGRASGTSGHKILSSDISTVKIESTKYPFCFFGSVQDPASTSGVCEFLPFNQDLNRFLLFVQNASAARYEITWGIGSKEFSGAQLSVGINLAAEFKQNPFSDLFITAENTFKARQTHDIHTVQGSLHSLINWRINVPAEEDAYRRMTSELIEKMASYQVASAKTIRPVEHTIGIRAIK